MRQFASILLLAWPAMAAVITGTVSDIDGRLVVGATVRLDNGSDTKTGEDGAYRLDPATPGEHKLTAVFDGFATIEKSITSGPLWAVLGSAFWSASVGTV